MTLANSLAALEDKSHIADIRGGGGTSRRPTTMLLWPVSMQHVKISC